MFTTGIFKFVAVALAGAMAAWSLPSKNNLVPRIIGGEPARGDKYSSSAIVFLTPSVYDSYMCGGTLIAPNIVLTAANCINPDLLISYNASEIQVVFGSANKFFANELETFTVSEVRIHPDYSTRTYINDIAILILDNPVPSSMATPIKIYTGDYYLDTPLDTTGYGITNLSQKNTYPESLMTLGIKVGDGSYCKKIYPSWNYDRDICSAYIGGKASCVGDGGSPLITDTESGEPGLLGIFTKPVTQDIKLVNECGARGTTNLFIRVGNYMSFITNGTDIKSSSISITNSTRRNPDPSIVVDGDGDDDSDNKDSRGERSDSADSIDFDDSEDSAESGSETQSKSDLDSDDQVIPSPSIIGDSAGEFPSFLDDINEDNDGDGSGSNKVFYNSLLHIGLGSIVVILSI